MMWKAILRIESSVKPGQSILKSVQVSARLNHIAGCSYLSEE
jgi:hypothetical protein